MTTEFQKSVREALANLYPDHLVVKKDGSVVFRQEFFYRHGQSAERWKDNVCETLRAAGIQARLEAHEDWAPWPKTSYFTVIVRKCP